MVGQDREEANRLQQAKWELTSGTTLCKVARNSVNRLELRKNVVANYPFESSRGFPGVQQNRFTAGGDRTAWLGWEESNSEMSSQIIPLKGRTDFR